jgi:hypothetical protein
MKAWVEMGKTQWRSPRLLYIWVLVPFHARQEVDPVSIFNQNLTRFLVGICSGLHGEHGDGNFVSVSSFLNPRRKETRNEKGGK